jgi:ferric-dicitrate binding protein FerR (iron transport regulator)
VNQLESTLEVLKDRSGDAVEAVQHGVEALGTRLGVIEPPRRRRKAPWLFLVLVAAVAGVVWWQARSRRATADAEFDEVTGEMPSSRSA